MFGTVLENVVVDPETRAIDLESAAITENPRASYPIHFIPKHVTGGMAGHPSHILFLTCDAYGIMPPIARLSPAQAMYHFLSGYTGKVAGTERGVTEPKATFSTCFGAPFLPLRPNVYASLLGEKIATHGVQCWLVNTGWTGGPYGVGQRIRLGHARSMVRAALAGKLDRITPRPTPCSESKSRCRSRACRRRCFCRAAPGATRRRTMPRRRGSCRCSGRTSLSSRTRCTPRSGTRGHGDRIAAEAAIVTRFEVVRDPLWDNIRLDPEALAVVDTPAVQRLRYVRHLGHAFLVYPGATHSRFEPALSAYHLAPRVLAQLLEPGAARIWPAHRVGPSMTTRL